MVPCKYVDWGMGGRGHVQTGFFLCQWSSYYVCDKGTGLPVFIKVWFILLLFFFTWVGGGVPSVFHICGPSYKWGEQMNWMAEQFGIFENKNLTLQRHHVAIRCKLLTRTKHVILMFVFFLFWNHIINKVIKYCLTVCPITDRCVTRSWLCVEGSCEVHVTVLVCGVKRTSTGAIMLMMHWPSTEEMWL